MTDKERLTKLLTTSIGLGSDKVVILREAAELIADDLIANGVTFSAAIPGHDDQYNIAEMAYNNGYAKGLEDGKPKWIPGKKPPKIWKNENGDAINFLAVIPCIGVDIANWIEPTRCWFCMGVPCKVSSWMPLPEPPKDEQNI